MALLWCMFPVVVHGHCWKKPFEYFLLVFVLFLTIRNIILTEETDLLFDTGLESVCTCERQPTTESPGSMSIKILCRKNCVSVWWKLLESSFGRWQIWVKLKCRGIFSRNKDTESHESDCSVCRRWKSNTIMVLILMIWCFSLCNRIWSAVLYVELMPEILYVHIVGHGMLTSIIFLEQCNGLRAGWVSKWS